MKPEDATLLAVLLANVPLAITAVVAAIVALRNSKRLKEMVPRKNTKSDIEWQQEVIAAFASQNSLTAQLSEANSKQALALAAAGSASAQQAATIAEQNSTIRSLIAKLDGMPVMIAEQTAIILLKTQYGEEMKKVLLAQGVHLEDQPVEKPSLPLTPLVPPTLLNDLVRERADVLKPTVPDKSVAVKVVGELIETEPPVENSHLPGVPS